MVGKKYLSQKKKGLHTALTSSSLKNHCYRCHSTHWNICIAHGASDLSKKTLRSTRAIQSSQHHANPAWKYWVCYKLAILYLIYILYILYMFLYLCLSSLVYLSIVHSYIYIYKSSIAAVLGFSGSVAWFRPPVPAREETSCSLKWVPGDRRRTDRHVPKKLRHWIVRFQLNQPLLPDFFLGGGLPYRYMPSLFWDAPKIYRHSQMDGEMTSSKMVFECFWTIQIRSWDSCVLTKWRINKAFKQRILEVRTKK